MSSNNTMVLVGCGKVKDTKPRKAKNLYLSSYFQKKRKYAELEGDDWRILSAKYGVLCPEQVVEPYNIRIDDVSPSEWSKKVKRGIDDLEFDELVILAGRDYIDPVDELLERYKASRPFDNTEGIGEQEGWLTEQISDILIEQHESAIDW